MLAEGFNGMKIYIFWWVFFSICHFISLPSLSTDLTQSISLFLIRKRYCEISSGRFRIQSLSSLLYSFLLTMCYFYSFFFQLNGNEEKSISMILLWGRWRKIARLSTFYISNVLFERKRFWRVFNFCLRNFKGKKFPSTPFKNPSHRHKI